MTDNQEKELFIKINSLVNGVQAIQSDVVIIKETLNEHSQILNEHSQILNEHSRVLENHSQKLESHSRILERLDARTDTIAGKVIDNENRLSAVEKDVVDWRSGIN